MKFDRPRVIVLAGPNGAGKSTTAPLLLRDALAVEEFVNADTLAQGLSAFAPEKVAVEAGRIMLKRLGELAEKRKIFAFETTLAARSFAPWLEGLMNSGYKSHLIFLALPNVGMAVDRVAQRVKLGGHDIPKTVIKRRFEAGLKNFFRLYRKLVFSWLFYDNSIPARPLLVAAGDRQNVLETHDSPMYKVFLREYGDDR
jgi:predicted ABC-type ATPase